MTAKKDLKKLVRERQLRTGESYTAALRHVLAQRPEADPVDRAGTPPLSVIEFVDLTAEAERLGLRCHATIDAALAPRVDGVELLRRMRELLVATATDPAMERFRTVMLYGEI